ncbi:MAG: glycosyltransferase family 4 protein [Calditrichaeota bacterium]|nr:MAG: glycosyltransferase family 4 protein [Calditrichota bacterium]
MPMNQANHSDQALLPADLTVCLVTRQYPPDIGGVGHSAHRVAHLLKRQGVSVHVAVIRKHPEPVLFDEAIETTEQEGIPVHRIRVFHPPGGDNDVAVLTRYNREIFQALCRLQERFAYSLWHGFFLYPAGYAATMVARLYGCKSIVSIRGNDVGKYAFDPLRVDFVRLALQRADFVTSVATSLLQLADRTLAPVSDRSRTILNSIPPDSLQITDWPQLPLSGLVVGSTGLFRYKKGLVYLFKALAQLKEKLAFSLLLAGDFFSPQDREPHLAWLQQYGLAEQTVVTGAIPHQQMVNYLQLFDVLVYPSLYSEGCPLSLMEAMAMGKAIIASRSGAIPELIEHGETGLLVSPGSSEEIAEALLYLARYPAERERLGRNALQRAEELSPERETEAWLQVYRSVLNPSPAYPQ